MWESVDSPNRTNDMTWLVDGTRNNTIMWYTDDSYNTKSALKVSSTGWMAYCIVTNNRMTGHLFQMPDDTGPYRGEQLGLCGIHHFIAALCMFYNIEH